MTKKESACPRFQRMVIRSEANGYLCSAVHKRHSFNSDCANHLFLIRQQEVQSAPSSRRVIVIDEVAPAEIPALHPANRRLQLLRMLWRIFDDAHSASFRSRS